MRNGSERNGGMRNGHDRSLVEMLSIADWRSFVPETAALLVAIWLVRAALPAGFSAPGMPHPFWAPVLLMSCQYGVMAGLFATLAATAAFFLGGLPDRSAAQDFYAYAAVVAGQPCAWFGTALILGGLRTLHLHHQAQMQAELEHTVSSAEDLADGLERAVGEVARLERQIATQSSTLTSFIHSLARIELSDRASLAVGVADLVRHGVGATTFTVYVKGRGTLEPLVGVENGTAVAPGALVALDPSRFDGPCNRPSGPQTVLPGMVDVMEPPPRWTPIPAPGSGETLGVVLCGGPPPSPDQAVTDRRLVDLCRVLGVLLSAGPPGSDNG